MKRYRIADLLVDMDVSGRTEQQAEPYRCDAEGPANITIECDGQGIFEKVPEYGSAEMAEYSVTSSMFARGLLRYEGTFLHASSILYDGKAYLFSANSGTGKSTHTEKWCRLFGAQYLNDDKPALRIVDNVWMAYGTPWSGKYDLSTPAGAPLGGVAFVKRGEVNSIRRISAAEALPQIFPQSLRKLGRGQMQKQLELLDNLVSTVPFWELTCRNDDEAAFVSHAAMTGR